MNEILPLAPQAGLSESAFLWIAVAIGGFFGFFLEKAGFSTAKNLTSIFILRDFRVFRVMFTAVLTAMIGSQLLHHTGMINLGFVGFDATFLWPMLLGGLLFGVGFYVGGFCPGTAAVALMRGRWDAPAFLFGIVLGLYGFALLFDGVGTTAWFSGFYAPATATRQTLYEGGAVWPWVLGNTLAAFAGFQIVPWVERKFALKTVEELARDKEGGKPVARETPQLSGWFWRRAAPAMTLILVAVLIGVETQTDRPILIHDSSREAALALESPEDGSLDSRTLAGWLIDNGYKLADEKPVAMYLFDLRSEHRRLALPLRYAEPIAAADIAESDMVSYLRNRIPKPERSKPLIFIGERTEDVERLVRELRESNFKAYALEGGEDGWRERVLEAPDANLVIGGMAIDDTLARVKSWLAGESETLPPRFVFPGAIPPRTKAASVKASGAGSGGGCG